VTFPRALALVLRATVEHGDRRRLGRKSKLAKFGTNASDISAKWLNNICLQDDPIFAPYLKGLFDGVRETSAERRLQIICPVGDIDGGQLKRWSSSPWNS
jgi:hypothetical protein